MSRHELRPLLARDIIALERRESGHLGFFRIDPQAPENMELLRSYLADLEKPVLDKILELSGGVFLNAHHLALTVDLGIFSEDQPPELATLYTCLLQHLRERAGDSIYRQIHLRLIATLLAAREPLAPSVLVAHWGLPREALRAALADLSFLLHAERDQQEETVYRVGHQIVADALRAAPDVASLLPTVHAEYADKVHSEVSRADDRGRWSEVQPADDPAFAYALLHLPFHIQEGGHRTRAARVASDPDRRAALLDTAQVLMGRGQAGQAVALTEAAVLSFRGTERRHGGQDLAATQRDHAEALLAHAGNLVTVGRYPQAQRKAALAADKDLAGDRLLHAKVQHIRGRVLVELERFEEAGEAYASARETFRSLDMKPEETDIISFSSDVHLELGNLDAAWEAASVAYDAYSRFPDPMGCAEAAWTLGDVCVVRGQRDEAERWYLQSIAKAEECASPTTMLSPLRGLGQLLMDSGRREEGVALFSRALGIAVRFGDRGEERAIRKLLAAAGVVES